MTPADGGVLFSYEALREDGSVIYTGCTTNEPDLDFHLKGHPHVWRVRVKRFKLTELNEVNFKADRSEKMLRTWAKRNHRVE